MEQQDVVGVSSAVDERLPRRREEATTTTIKVINSHILHTGQH